MKWIKTERNPSVERWSHLTLSQYELESEDRHGWRVGNSVGTLGEKREWYVMIDYNRKGHWTSTHLFRRRFATAEAAMKAVERYISKPNRRD